MNSEISTAESELKLRKLDRNQKFRWNQNQRTWTRCSWITLYWTHHQKSEISAVLELRKFNKVTSKSLDQQFSTHIMTRSSKSASIACYDLQNARRESLLSQNWTASEEEDMNVSSNTEEKNMNMLFFDHEMIKISISTELNAWISTHEADNIVVFIKYICQQHDIEIKTHNNMIQMLEDVNEINIILKIMQTRLQKENRNKNVIIHHLKAASSQQSTSISED